MCNASGSTVVVKRAYDVHTIIEYQDRLEVGATINSELIEHKYTEMQHEQRKSY